MNRIPGLVLLAAATVVAGVDARADEVVYFTNGTSMTIRSHTVDGDMIRVDLGSQSLMGFPASMVDRIEEEGRKTSVYANPLYHPANQAVAGGPTGGVPERDYTVRGIGRGARPHVVTPGGGPGRTDPRLLEAAGMGNEAGREAGRGVVGRKMNLRAVGRIAGPNDNTADTPAGTYELGSKLALQSTSPSARTKYPSLEPRIPATFQSDPGTGDAPAEGGDAAAPPPPPPEDGGGSGS